MLSDELKPVLQALQAGDRVQARELLKPILASRPTADAWYLSAHAADAPQEALDYLNKALALNPNHVDAKAAKEKLQATMVQSQSTPASPSPTLAQSPASAPQGESDVYEMLWDCRFCGTKKLLGLTHRYCPNCGGAQDPAWRYFPSDDEKVAVKNHIYVGADRTCPACGSLNGAKAEFCGNCGSPLTKGAEAKRLQAQEKKEGERFETEDLAKRQRQEFEQSVGGRMSSQSKPQAQAGGLQRWHIIAAALLLIVCGGIAALVFWTRDASVLVSNFRWEREVRVEQLNPQAGRVVGGCGAAPIDAYNCSERREQVSSRQVPDGEECRTVRTDRGDGTFKEERRCTTKYRSEPVYGQVGYYTVNRWGYERSVTAKGDKNTPLVWPEANLRGGTCLGCERYEQPNDGKREKYLLIFSRQGNKPFECPVPFEQWQAAKIEDRFTVKVGAILNDPRCDSLQAAK